MQNFPRLIFAGTPEFAAHALQALLAAGFDVPLVVTQPDRPAGRGLKLQPSATKEIALAHKLPVYQPTTLKSAEVQSTLASIAADVMVVAAYGLLLPESVLCLAQHGCLNIHASLLPRWRGAAPIQRALLAGDTRTGITIMQMNAGLDTGPIVSCSEIAIEARETAGSLRDKLAHLGASEIVAVLSQLKRTGGLTSYPQPNEGVSHAAKISAAEAMIDWSLSAAYLDRQIRAFNPHPGAYTYLNGQLLKIWQAFPQPAARGTPGEVLQVDRDGILVMAGDSALRLAQLQLAGRKAMSAQAFLAGQPALPGQKLGIA